MAEKRIKITVVVDGKKQIIDVTNQVKNLGKQSAAVQDKLVKSAAGFAKNTTSSFAKQAQGLGGLVHVYATVAANVFALSAAYGVLKRSADLTLMKKSAEELSVAAGISFTQIADDMQKITGGAIDFAEAMRSANLALSGGASTSQLKGITEIATKAAIALGRSVP